VSLEAAPAVLWDAIILPDSQSAVLAQNGQAIEFLKDQYRHCKPILLLGSAADLLAQAGIPTELASGAPDPGLLRFAAGEVAAATRAFVGALTRHRHFERETDPPRV